jgi:hypothetical protein
MSANFLVFQKILKKKHQSKYHRNISILEYVYNIKTKNTTPTILIDGQTEKCVCLTFLTDLWPKSDQNVRPGRRIRCLGPIVGFSPINVSEERW